MMVWAGPQVLGCTTSAVVATHSNARQLSHEAAVHSVWSSPAPPHTHASCSHRGVAALFSALRDTFLPLRTHKLLPAPLPYTAILLYGAKQYDAAKLHMTTFRVLFADLDEEARQADPEVLQQGTMLGQLLGA